MTTDASSAPHMDAGPVPALKDAGARSCVRGEYAAQLRPLDMFILLDQSGSMTEDEDRWTPVTEAIDAFVHNPSITRTGVALQYFPIGQDDAFKCEAANYQLPDVPMAPLPGNAEPISSSIAAHHFTQAECCDTPEHSGTPTRPAMQGAIAYMRAFLGEHPDHTGVVLLATDGEPSDVCDDNAIEDVAAVLREGFEGSPSIGTYVIGIGDNEHLEELASAGGTGLGPLVVDGSGAQTEGELLEALATIRSQALPCDYPLQDVLDPRKLNVEHTRGSEPPVTLRNVPGRAECSAAGVQGWYYDQPDQPASLTLCPEACAALAEDADSVLRIVEGCEIQVF